jgi:chromosome partitioning protein
MFIVAVANSKGGCGKTTVATHIAAHFAARGFRTGLADLDRQQSARAWLGRRPDAVARIVAVDLDIEDGKLPKGLDRLVVDCPAAMTKDTVKEVVRRADTVVVPVLPSTFDEDGTRRFLKLLSKLKTIQHNRRDVAFVANRTRARTRGQGRSGARGGRRRPQPPGGAGVDRAVVPERRGKDREDPLRPPGPLTRHDRHPRVVHAGDTNSWM